jgi:hypothetical protein
MRFCVFLLILTGFVPASGQQTGSSPVPAGKDEAGHKMLLAEPSRPRTKLRMSPAIVCKSIEGYEKYERLSPPQLTADEKLLVYYRPLKFESVFVDGTYQSHFVQDGEIRKRGEKGVLRQKQKLLDETAKDQVPPHHLYLRNTVSLKGLAPGDYEFTIILHDAVAKTPPSTQVVRFKIVAATTVVESKDGDDQGSAATMKPSADSKSPAPRGRVKPER